ncbi:hypothetical protein JZ751_017295 [Albula glossodonta]|uniref:mitogen-activated protein kinase kinase n=1 Tax=Albula glossodonta TaxID=121402 RepID=A0A8T2MX02_9TELE|nr:hypothetical protein JZ751_017295 [Albula glossodonta]
METEGIVIRIKTPGGDMDSSVDSPSLLSFNDLLVAIREVMPEATITAFEYEDEVGDRITVRSDEELKAMMSYINEQDIRYEELLGHGNGGTVYKLPAWSPLSGAGLWTVLCGSGPSCTGWAHPVRGGSIGIAELRTVHSHHSLSFCLLIHTPHPTEPAVLNAVHPAYHLLGKRVLAVKVIPLDITVELQKQIMSELEILYKCDSPYIITFYSAFFVENRISICTEFMDGGSLDVYRRIPEHVLGRIAVAVSVWDVKPSNMLVNTRGQVKLCDFGVSTQLVNSIAKTYVGTNAYMALEECIMWGRGLFSRVPLTGRVFTDRPAARSLCGVVLYGIIMRKLPKERPAPNDLMGHPFIVQYNDGSVEVVSMWVCRSLEERRAQQQHPPTQCPM